MNRTQFRVHLDGIATIELDEAVLRVVDDEWRKQFYPLFSVQEIAEHIAYNLIINNACLSQLDGWADQPDSNAVIVDEPEWDTFAKEI